MKVIHTLPHLRTEASGYGQSVVALCRGLMERGHDVAVHTLAPQPHRPLQVPAAFHSPVPWLPEKLGVSRSLKLSIFKAAESTDIFHAHSLWMMPSIYPYQAARRTRGTKWIISPRGTLEPAALGISRYRKKVVWLLLQRKAVQAADVVHATSEAEAIHIRRMGIEAPIAVIPNGVDLPKTATRPPDHRPYRTLLTLGRIGPIKNLESLMEAWRLIAHRHADWRLRIVGPESDPKYFQRIRDLANQLDRVDMVGPAFGLEKSQEYWSSDLFVLPTHSENFGMVVAEALAHELPVIATKGAPWEGLVREGCGWWVDHGVENLCDILDAALALPAAVHQEMGTRGREWIRQDFSWDAVADQIEATYFWSMGHGPQPSFVQDSPRERV